MSLSIETAAPVLLQSLTRAGWGELSGREWQGVRSTLTAIVARSKGKKDLDVTVWQLSRSTGLSEKWTSRCLRILDGLGVIRWQRGQVIEGKPTAGFITIVKAVLLDLVRQAWAKGRANWIERRAQTARRLAMLKNPKAHLSMSSQPELSADLNAISSAPPRRALDSDRTTPPPDWAIRKETKMDTLLCPHGYANDNHCKDCQQAKTKAMPKPEKWTKEHRQNWLNKRARENQARLEHEAEETRRQDALAFQREHPCPPDVDPREWPQVFINRLFGKEKVA